MALITAAEARVMIPALTATGADTDLGTLITRADAAIAHYCGLPAASATAAPTLESTTYTEYHDGPAADEPRALALGVRHVSAVTSIHIDPLWSYGASTLVDSANYSLDGLAGRVRLLPTSSTGWTPGYRAIKVVYVAGFTSGNAPADLKQAAALLVAHWWRLRSGVSRSSTSGQTGGASLRDEVLPAAVRQLVGRYVLPSAVL